MHPLKKLCETKKLKYKGISEAIRKANGGKGPSAQLIAQYVGGFKHPSLKSARMIHNAFPEISRESLLYFRNDDAA